MKRKYFVVDCRLDGVASYLIWYNNDVDGLAVRSDGSISLFREPSTLSSYAAQHGLEFEDEVPSVIDLDAIARWLGDPRPDAIDCELFLNAWNLFDDVASSVGCSSFRRDSRRASLPYGKLFWGINIPVMTPSGEHYEPVWSDEEVETIQKILGDGIRLVRLAVREEGDLPGH
jgi:hypothetical protein